MDKNKIDFYLYLVTIVIIVLAYFIYLSIKHNNIREKDIYEVDFWLKYLDTIENNKIVMEVDDINKFNADILKNNEYMVNFKAVSDELFDMTKIKEKILRTKYINNLPDEEYLNLKTLENKIEISYGLIINRTNLRVIPTDFKIFSDGDENFDFDNLQQKELKYGEPIIILHSSKNKEWFYIQTNNIDGWVEAKNVAIFNSKSDFLNYVNMNNFVMVIDKNLIIDDKFLDMGVKIQLKNEDDFSYEVLMPDRNENGNLFFYEKTIKKNDKFNRGYLDYTRFNIAKQALKYYGEEYGWGGLKNSVDCSGLVNNIYSTFGFKMPRNSKQQQTSSGVFTNFDNIFSRKNKILNKTPTGALLYMKGHIMVHLGKVDGKYYFINAISGYSDGKKIINVMKVNIMDLNAKRKNGKTFKKSLLSVTNMSY